MMSTKTTLLCIFGLIIAYTSSQSYIETKTLLKWSDHQALCSFSHDTNLASIHSNTQLMDAGSSCTTTENCWIGLYRDEGTFKWDDLTPWDFGTNISQYDTQVWNTGEPNNSGGNENCVEILMNNQWNDQTCTHTNYALCNYPTTTYVLNDKPNYVRVPQNGLSIGNMDVLDDIYVQCYIIIHSWPAAYANILHVKGGISEWIPGIWIHGDNVNRLHFAYSTVLNGNVVSFIATELETLYHTKIHLTQDYIKIMVNDTVVADTSTTSHRIYNNVNIYLANPYEETADVSIYGLTISSSNSNKPGEAYNYLCDYNNRFTDLNNVWSANTPSGCTLESTYWDVAGVGTFSWMGEKDTSSILWTDYSVESEIYIDFGTGTAGIVFRAETQNRYYDFYIAEIANRLEFAKADGGWNVLWSRSYTISTGNTYKLRVEISGNTFNLYCQDVWLDVVTDNSYTTGSVGLHQHQARIYFNTLRIMFPNNNRLYTASPTVAPSNSPSSAPSHSPTSYPTIVTTQPTILPTTNPIVSPTMSTVNPTQSPTHFPSKSPTKQPTKQPSNQPSYQPTNKPTNGGSSGEHNVETTVVKTTIDNKGSDAAVQNDDTNAALWIYILIIALALLCCCFIVIVFIWRRRRKKNIKVYLGATDEVQISSINGVTPISDVNREINIQKSEDNNDDDIVLDDVNNIDMNTPMGIGTNEHVNNDDDEIDLDDIMIDTPMGPKNNAEGDFATPMIAGNVTKGNDEFVVKGNDELEQVETDEGTSQDDDGDDDITEHLDNVYDTQR